MGAQKLTRRTRAEEASRPALGAGITQTRIAGCQRFGRLRPQSRIRAVHGKRRNPRLIQGSKRHLRLGARQFGERFAGAGNRLLMGRAKLRARQRVRPGAVLARHLLDLRNLREGGHGIFGAANGKPVGCERNVGGGGDRLLIQAARGRMQGARTNLVRAVREGRDVEAVLQHGVGAHGFGERSGVQVRAVQGGEFIAGGTARALLATLDAGALGAGYAADSGGDSPGFGGGVGGGVTAYAGGVAGAVAVEFTLAIARNTQPQVGAGSQRNLDAHPARNAKLRGVAFLNRSTLPHRLRCPVMSSFSGSTGHDRFHLNERAAIGPADLPPDEQPRRACRITGGIITGGGRSSYSRHSSYSRRGSELVESSLKQVGVVHSIPL